VTARTKTFLAVAGGALLGAVLLTLALKDADFPLILETLKGGAWGWVVPLLGVTVLSVVLRAWRWRLLLDAPAPGVQADAPPTPLGLTVGAVFVGYLVNLAAPRLGEVARAATIGTRTARPLPSVFGTVVAERLLDVATLGLAVLSVGVLYRERMSAVAALFGAGLRERLAGLANLSPGTGLLIGAIAVLLLAGAVLLGRRLLRGTTGRLRSIAGQFADGVATLARTGRVPALLLSTAGIWACYAIMADLPLRILGLSEAFGLTMLDAWAVMAVGAIGMALPSPGGAGSYHYATVQALGLLFSVPASPAATYALLAHAAQLLFYALGGFAALLWLGTSFRSVTSSARAASAD
jgi:hypothetical protein